MRKEKLSTDTNPGSKKGVVDGVPQKEKRKGTSIEDLHEKQATIAKLKRVRQC